MKTIKLIISFILFTICSNSFAQTPQLQTVEFESEFGTKSRRLINSEMYSGDDPDEFYIVEHKRSDYIISTYDAANLKKLTSFTMKEPEVENKEPRWVNFFFHESKVTVVYSIWDKRADKYTVYGKILTQEGDVDVAEITLMEIKSDKKKNVGSISFTLSEDKTKILLFREAAGKRYEKEKIELALFDYDLNEILNRKLNFPYKYTSIYVQNIDVSNEGKVVIATRWSPPRKTAAKRSRTPVVDEVFHKIFTIDGDNDELEEIELEQKGYSFSSLNGHIINEEGVIMFTGFYRDSKSDSRKRDKYKGQNGVYYIVMDLEDNELITRSYDKIDDETMVELLGANTTKKRAKKSADKGFGLTNFKIINVVYRAGGGATVTLEKSYMVESCSTDKNGNRTCTYTYYDLELLEFIIDADGKIEHTYVIPKKQISGSPFLHGTVTLETEGTILYVYNDTDKNFNPKKNKNADEIPTFTYTYTSANGLFSKNKKRLAAAYINESGKPKKIGLTASFKENIIIQPKNSKARLSNEAIIVWGYNPKTKKSNLVKIFVD